MQLCVRRNLTFIVNAIKSDFKSWGIVPFHVWGFESLFSSLSYAKDEIKIIFICDIVDQTTKYLLASKGIPVVFYDTKSWIMLR